MYLVGLLMPQKDLKFKDYRVSKIIVFIKCSLAALMEIFSLR